MARGRFRFNQQAVKKVVNEAAGKVEAKVSTLLNGMSPEFTGWPVEEIKPVLQSRWRAAVGGSITDPKLSAYAAQIAAGESFDVKVTVR
ncbi:hypothetical protein ACWDF9_08185 [Streptomyces rubiginosohelvolus]